MPTFFICTWSTWFCFLRLDILKFSHTKISSFFEQLQSNGSCFIIANRCRSILSTRFVLTFCIATSMSYLIVVSLNKFLKCQFSETNIQTSINTGLSTRWQLGVTTTMFFLFDNLAPFQRMQKLVKFCIHGPLTFQSSIFTTTIAVYTY